VPQLCWLSGSNILNRTICRFLQIQNVSERDKKRDMFKRHLFTHLLLMSIDVGLTLLALRLAKLLREIMPWGVYLAEPLDFNPWLYLLVPGIWMVVFAALKVYDPTRSLRHAADLPTIWSAVIGASLIFAGVAYLLFRELSRFLFFYFFVLDLLFLCGWRWGMLRFPNLARYLHSADKRRVLIVGTGSPGRELARIISKHPAAHLSLVGFAADANEQNCPQLGYPLLGTLSDLPRLVVTYQLQEIIFALPPSQQANLRSVVIALQTMPVNLRLIPDIFDLVFIRASVEEFEGIPIIGLHEPIIEEPVRLIKRLFDLVVSSLLLIVFAPLMLGIALLIKLDSPGPIFFRQQRVAEKGRLFWMVKFRSMVDGAEKVETKFQQQTAEGCPFFSKMPQDARITRVGHWLRRSSLDELPQLINVLKGEMSLVGPRPELPWLVEAYEPWQCKRFAVPQGMTGWWQVNGRMERATPQQRAEDDLFYIRNYSLWLDLRILWKTVQAVIYGQGAY
jgi:exopolysaccharide biosynthesis polyprenyl glycosylphosphotransferase